MKKINKKTIITIASAIIVIVGAIFGVDTAGLFSDVSDTRPTQSAESTTKQEENTTRNQNTYSEISTNSEYEYRLTFYSDKLLMEHYDKHGKEMGFSSPEEYEAAASDVVFNEDALHKTEKEDGDDVYYLETTNEFVIVSTSGYIRTYFNPDDGINYFNRQ